MRKIVLDWRFWAAVVITLLAITLWLAYQGDLTCRIPRKRAQLEISKANSCFEFWVSRYQQSWTSLLTVLGALFAAWLAWISVSKQADQQARANWISEMTFWQTRWDQAKAAHAHASAAMEAACAVREEIGKPYQANNPHIAAVERLKDRGLFPFQVIPTTGIEHEALRFNSAALAVNELHKNLAKNGSNWPATDSEMQARLIDMSQLAEGFEKLLPDIDKEIGRSDAMMKRLGGVI